jgi:UDP-galactopyranose mutase
MPYGGYEVSVPLPVNFTSIQYLFPQNYNKIKNELIQTYGENKTIPILNLRQSNNLFIKDIADYIYKKIFLHYTSKKWGTDPDLLDPFITGIMPIRLSNDNRTFLYKYQVMPKNGFTFLFKNMLDHQNIQISYNTNAVDVLQFDKKNKKIFYRNKIYDGHVIYTGPIDEIFNYIYGYLPYRSVRFDIECFQQDYIQDVATLTWPDKRPAMRRTEMKRLTQQIIPKITITSTEYPGAYNPDDTTYNEPYYPILNEANIGLYNRLVRQPQK